ncbi:MAG TPA: multidrug efflux RND transporter permease subunit [Thermodesulfobacteriota bacterium]|nr:multidrug efflux RND transporter permease subunit [Thermodesulfobacteriota bacterium]
MFSGIFIDRPILAAVISIIIVLAGLVSALTLPIAQYPNITPVQIQVTATYPGADAEDVSNAVAAPIEYQVNGTEDMIYMYSTSSSTGNYTLSVFFGIDTDPDIAQVNVQNRVQWAMAQLPTSVQAQGIQVQPRTNSFLMVIALVSPDGTYDQAYLTNYANLYVLDAFKRIPGANLSQIFGVPFYAMRLWLKPDRMAQLKITATDIAEAVKAQNEQYSTGQIGQSPTSNPVELSFPIIAQGRMSDPSEFENIILRTDYTGAAVVRIKDVGHAELGMQSYSLRSRYDNKQAALIAVYQQADANALDVSKQVRQTLEELKKDFPPGLDYQIALDATKFIKASIDEVFHTLMEAVVLVVLVVFLFLQSFRATVIPCIAIVVSIVGTFIGMYALGFSINMLTLFGMVLAIGLVVDDAIVVVENVERNMHEFHLEPRQATRRAMEEVTGPVIAIVLVLGAVFIPTAFLGGITGQLYKQFAVTIAISMAISGFVALTLTPALAAIILKPQHGDKKGFLGRFFKWFNDWFDRMTHHYTNAVRSVIKRATLALILFGIMVVGIYSLFRTIPTSFVPAEDQGYLFGVAYLPDAASLDRTEKVGKQATDIFLKNPAVYSVAVPNGYSLLDSQLKTNAATLFISLKDYEEREEKSMQAPAIIQEVFPELAAIKDAQVFPMNPPSIPGLGVTGGFEFWVQYRGSGGYSEVDKVTREFIGKASQRPELVGLASTIHSTSQKLFLEVDRQKTQALGVPIKDVYDAMQTLYGSLYVSQFDKYSQVFQVILQAESRYRVRPEDIGQIYVRTSQGDMMPLSAVVKTRYTTGPDLVSRFNGFPSAKITGSAAPGYSSGQAIATMEEVAREVLPEGFTFAWSGEAFEEKQSGGTSSLAFIFGLILVFLILSAQYESWSLPLSVTLAVPTGIFGALLAVWLRGLDNDVYFQIGLVTLVGLSAKNAILIVEFAVLKRREGLSFLDAAAEAARLRLRPIVMTSLCFILGMVPLVIASGAGANSRHSIGTGVMGGMTSATLLAVFFVPLFFFLVENFSERFFGKEKKVTTAEPVHGDGVAQTVNPKEEKV